MNDLLQIGNLYRKFPTVNSKRKATFSIFKCKCGNTFEAKVENVKSGNTTSCGCSRTKYKHSNKKVLVAWRSMMFRCYNNKSKSYDLYGGRGIKVCSKWHDFSNFNNDMGSNFVDGLSLDRIDNDGNYEPSNCRWATKEVQARNTRVLKKTNTSGYRGVHYHKADKKWRSVIYVSNRQITIGHFDDPKHAAMAYDTFVIVYGLQHTTNFPKEIFQ
ncbi:MAG TPA: AP2 domain-containing protein [Methanosarcina sp.]|nr:AP2 domain-containing protein [Methanosarcina sp.]